MDYTPEKESSRPQSPVQATSTLPWTHLFPLSTPNQHIQPKQSQIKDEPISPTSGISSLKLLRPKSPIAQRKRQIKINTPQKKKQLIEKMDGNQSPHFSNGDFYNDTKYNTLHTDLRSHEGLPIEGGGDLYYDSQTEYQSDCFLSGGDSDFQRRSVRPKIASKPFPRKSKAGNQHYVTPSGATSGFSCNFIEIRGGAKCQSNFELPSKIREHLIDDHMRFSPFQCSNCKKVFTRLSILTRHLTKSQGGEERTCNNPPAGEDEHYLIRNSVKNALWEIRQQQHEVDVAVSLIMRYNGRLEERRRRGGHGVSPRRSPECTTRGAFSRRSPHEQASILPSQFPLFSSSQQQSIYTTTSDPFDSGLISPQRSILPSPGYSHQEGYYQQPTTIPSPVPEYWTRTNNPWDGTLENSNMSNNYLLSPPTSSATQSTDYYYEQI
ncbi:hypothetical protein EDC01DRAFT_43776 [Geopyxis carbonaria]|nr:hypothetical protein EDC01DRAFT_43776 [Geopyxis carbonaria]